MKAKPMIPSLLVALASCQTALASEVNYSIHKDVDIPTSQGINLSANIFMPIKPGKYPIIMSMGAYNKDTKNEEAAIFGVGQIAASKNTGFEQPDPEFWTNAGYIVINVDSPASGKSEGVLNLLSDYEAKSYYDAIEWAGVQSWSNGNVGLNGVSYYAMSQWNVAALNPPHLKAIAPEEGTYDFYRDIETQGGIPSTDFRKQWSKFRIRAQMNPNAEIKPNSLASEDPAPKLFNDWWQAYTPDLSRITVPAYVVASWTDQGMHTRGTLLAYQGISSKHKWLEVHGRKKWEYYYQREHMERVKKFFDYYLKNEDNDFNLTPKIRYELRNGFYDGSTKFASEYPLPSTELTKLYLSENSQFSLTNSDDKEAASYQSDDKSQITFNYTFNEDTELTGAMMLKLWVQAHNSDDMDLFIGISKLNSKGKEVYFSGYDESEKGHVASGWLRVSRRELDQEKSKPNQPFLKLKSEQKLTPAQIVPVEIEILDSSTLFKKGESLVLRIQGSELDGAGGESAFGRKDKVNKGKHTVYYGGSHDSYLLIPKIKN